MCSFYIKNKLVTLCCCFFMLMGFPSLGQNVLFPTVPTSPQAASYGEFALNPSTGVPDVFIPLYEINHRGYVIPMGLKYYPQPLKPGYNFDVYGHGWGLFPNGIIYRSIEYLPDEWRDFKIESDKLGDFYQLPNNVFDYNLGHDKFNVILPDGSAFGFVMDYGANQKPVFTVSGGRQVKLTCSYTAYNINSFTLIDEKGVKYTFNGSDTQAASRFSGSYVSWQLTRIDLPHSAQPIVFNYNYAIKDPYQSVCYEPGIIISNGGNGSAANIPVGTSIYYTMKLLSSIQYGNTRIMFVYENDEPLATHNYVKKIRVFEGASPVRDITLGISTHGSENLDPCSGIQRLAKLGSISIGSSDSASSSQIYRFTYHPFSYFFSGTDHWGYFNNSGNQYDVANFNMYVGFDLDISPVVSQAAVSAVEKSTNDPSDFDKIKLSRTNNDVRKPSGPENHGVLSKLIYPTGGYTLFDFENHQYLTSTDANGNYISDLNNRKVAKAAGFRIKRITNYAVGGEVSKIIDYRYGRTYGDIYGTDLPAYLDPNSHTGVGEAVVEPGIFSYVSLRASFPTSVSLVRNIILGTNGQQMEWGWEGSFSALNFRRIVNGRPPVLYPEISIYHGEIDHAGSFSPEKTIGRTTHRYNVTQYGYDLMGNFREDLFFEYPQYFNGVFDYYSKSHVYNNIQKKLDYEVKENGFELVQEESYDWSEAAVSSLDYIYTNNYPEHSIPSNLQISDLVTPKGNVLGFSQLIYKTTTLHAGSNANITSTIRYGYNDRNQLTSVSTSGSKEELKKITYSYPDIANDGTTPIVVQEMVDRNIIYPVLETTTTVDQKVIAGNKTEYKEFNSGSLPIIMPTKLYNMEFRHTGNDYEITSEVMSYSPNGNPLEVRGSDDVYTSYLWGYDDRYMIAEVGNAHQNQIAYTSFEEDGHGNWIYDVEGVMTGESRTGSKSYSGTVSKTGLPLGKYIVNLWAKGNNSNASISVNGVSKTISNNWEMYEWELDNITSVTIVATGDKKIDEVRLLPSGAMMTSYTYKPLVGVMSSTDYRGEVVFYEYDNHNKVSVIRDHDGNILQHYDYRFGQDGE